MTDLRSLNARMIRWDELSGLDDDEPTMHRPNPKGGPKKALTVSISSGVAEILGNRRAESEVLFPACELVFPTIDRGGRNVVHIKNAEEDGLRDFGYTPHRARDTLATATPYAEVSVLATKILFNHRDKTVTEGYQRLGIEFLRAAVETVTEFLLEKVEVAAEEESEAA
jgi:integrase